MQNYPSDEQLVEMTRQLTQAQIDFWRHKTLFTWQWWFLVVLLIIPLIAWYKFADKKRLLQLILFFLLVMVMSITFDELFTILALRIYPHKFIPVLPRLTSVDYTIIPILFTLAYQRFVTWNSFWGGSDRPCFVSILRRRASFSLAGTLCAYQMEILLWLPCPPGNGAYIQVARRQDNGYCPKGKGNSPLAPEHPKVQCSIAIQVRSVC